MTDDKVWWSRERKLQGICDQIALASASRGNVLLLAHFESTLSSLAATLRSRSIECRTFSLFDSSALCFSAGAGQVWAGLARAFHSPPSITDNPSTAAYVEIVVAEHHPLRSRDESIIQALATIPCRTEITFHISLDDPLIVHFSGDSIQRLFRQLGASEVDSLSNPMITTAIRRAQEKLESQVPKDLPAQSIDDWFRYNLAQK